MGSIDPANFITVDKPPLATMVMGLSVRLFGLSSASILLPEALMGVATVGLVMATVRRTFGAPASVIAGLVTALTPAAVLIFRYNNPDALLTLLLVGAAYAFVRAPRERPAPLARPGGRARGPGVRHQAHPGVLGPARVRDHVRRRAPGPSGGASPGWQSPSRRSWSQRLVGGRR